MAPSPSAFEPLSASELDRLTEELAGNANPDALSLEGMDGLFCALIASPVNVPPDEFLPLIWGGEAPDSRGFCSIQQANISMSLMMRHWNSIIADLENEAIHFPLVEQAERGQMPGRACARGFMRGLQWAGIGWAELLDQEKDGELALIPLLASEPSTGLPQEPRLAQPPDQLQVSMAMALTHSYQYFAEAREAAAADRFEDSVIEEELYDPPARRRPTPTVGRNQPCPCGSGRRFKRCCGGPSSMHR